MFSSLSLPTPRRLRRALPSFSERDSNMRATFAGSQRDATLEKRSQESGDSADAQESGVDLWRGSRIRQIDLRFEASKGRGTWSPLRVGVSPMESPNVMRYGISSATSNRRLR